jgi:hypothetical protein
MPVSIYVSKRFPQSKRFEEYSAKLWNHFFKRESKRTQFKELQIRLYPLLEGSADENVIGYFSGERDCDELEIEISRNWFDRENQELVKYSIEELAVAVAHEMVHAKQSIRGELHKADFSIPYLEQPWEIEAHSLERELFEKYW